VSALGYPLLCEPGVEADDVIGTLVHQAREQSRAVLVATADKDFAQLVSEQVHLLNTMTGQLTDPKAVVEKYGVTPKQFRDFLALVGDKVDNIPGIPGCGPKTAAKWLNQYHDLDNLIAHADEIKGKVGGALREHLEQLHTSRELVTIRTDCKLTHRLDELQLHPPAPEALDLAERYELNSLKRALQSGEQLVDHNPAGGLDDAKARRAGYVIIDSPACWQDWQAKIRSAPIVALDTETDALSPMSMSIVGLSFAIAPGQAAYLPLAHQTEDQPDCFQREVILEELRDWLEDPQAKKVLQNAKFDQHALANHGINLAGVTDDTMLASYVLDSTSSRHDLDTLSKHWLNIETQSFTDLAGKGAKAKRFDQLTVAESAAYAAEDADVTLRLRDRIVEKLALNPELEAIYRDLECPLSAVLCRMERAGICVDAERLAKQGETLKKRIAEIEAKAHELAGRVFNLGSPKQLADILYEQLQLPVRVKTPKGEPSTNERALNELVDEHPLVALILDYRSLTKLTSTYIDKLPKEINPDTERVHSEFHQAVTATGRLSSSNPNLQNIPIRSDEGRRIRDAFVAPAGYTLLAADYSQIELRIMAHISGDAGLLKAFEQGEDIHKATAQEIFAAGGQVDDQMRRAAKAINFGLIYGMSAFGLARQIGVERKQAQEYIDQYFARYPGVAEYMENTRKLAREQGYVQTVFGRRLYLPEIRSRNAQRRAYAERTAINAPMQGTAADIIKKAMLAVDEKLVRTGQAKLILQVHDELIFEVPEAEAARLTDQIRQIMTSVTALDVPLLVDIGQGQSWNQAH
ncbi:MAG TPA: DNA polymerase I, partial [Halothiobacillaceae bacterium]|nr:DNA polymerase I [Halothiobacillaceae bacterium]